MKDDEQNMSDDASDACDMHQGLFDQLENSQPSHPLEP